MRALIYGVIGRISKIVAFDRGGRVLRKAGESCGGADMPLAMTLVDLPRICDVSGRRRLGRSDAKRNLFLCSEQHHAPSARLAFAAS